MECDSLCGAFTSLLFLSDDVLLHIFSFFSASSLCVVAPSVCHHFHNLSCEDSLWLPLCRRRWRNKLNYCLESSPSRLDKFQEENLNCGYSWKRRYALAEADSKRLWITEEEFTQLIFRFSDSRQLMYFHPDHSLQMELYPPMRWRMITKKEAKLANHAFRRSYFEVSSSDEEQQENDEEDDADDEQSKQTKKKNTDQDDEDNEESKPLLGSSVSSSISAAAAAASSSHMTNSASGSSTNPCNSFLASSVAKALPCVRQRPIRFLQVEAFPPHQMVRTANWGFRFSNHFVHFESLDEHEILELKEMERYLVRQRIEARYAADMPIISSTSSSSSSSSSASLSASASASSPALDLESAVNAFLCPSSALHSRVHVLRKLLHSASVDEMVHWCTLAIQLNERDERERKKRREERKKRARKDKEKCTEMRKREKREKSKEKQIEEQLDEAIERKQKEKGEEEHGEDEDEVDNENEDNGKEMKLEREGKEQKEGKEELEEEGDYLFKDELNRIENQSSFVRAFYACSLAQMHFALRQPQRRSDDDQEDDDEEGGDE